MRKKSARLARKPKIQIRQDEDDSIEFGVEYNSSEDSEEMSPEEFIEADRRRHQRVVARQRRARALAEHMECLSRKGNVADTALERRRRRDRERMRRIRAQTEVPLEKRAYLATVKRIKNGIEMKLMTPEEIKFQKEVAILRPGHGRARDRNMTKSKIRLPLTIEEAEECEYLRMFLLKIHMDYTEERKELCREALELELGDEVPQKEKETDGKRKKMADDDFRENQPRWTNLLDEDSDESENDEMHEKSAAVASTFDAFEIKIEPDEYSSWDEEGDIDPQSSPTEKQKTKNVENIIAHVLESSDTRDEQNEQDSSKSRKAKVKAREIMKNYAKSKPNKQVEILQYWKAKAEENLRKEKLMSIQKDWNLARKCWIELKPHETSTQETLEAKRREMEGKIRADKDLAVSKIRNDLAEKRLTLSQETLEQRKARIADELKRTAEHITALRNKQGQNEEQKAEMKRKKNCVQNKPLPVGMTHEDRKAKAAADARLRLQMEKQEYEMYHKLSEAILEPTIVNRVEKFEAIFSSTKNEKCINFWYFREGKRFKFPEIVEYRKLLYDFLMGRRKEAEGSKETDKLLESVQVSKERSIKDCFELSQFINEWGSGVLEHLKFKRFYQVNKMKQAEQNATPEMREQMRLKRNAHFRKSHARRKLGIELELGEYIKGPTAPYGSKKKEKQQNAPSTPKPKGRKRKPEDDSQVQLLNSSSITSNEIQDAVATITNNSHQEKECSNENEGFSDRNRGQDQDDSNSQAGWIPFDVPTGNAEYQPQLFYAQNYSSPLQNYPNTRSHGMTPQLPYHLQLVDYTSQLQNFQNSQQSWNAASSQVMHTQILNYSLPSTSHHQNQQYPASTNSQSSYNNDQEQEQQTPQPSHEIQVHLELSEQLIQHDDSSSYYQDQDDDDVSSSMEESIPNKSCRKVGRPKGARNKRLTTPKHSGKRKDIWNNLKRRKYYDAETAAKCKIPPHYRKEKISLAAEVPNPFEKLAQKLGESMDLLPKCTICDKILMNEVLLEKHVASHKNAGQAQNSKEQEKTEAAVDSITRPKKFSDESIALCETQKLFLVEGKVETSYSGDEEETVTKEIPGKRSRQKQPKEKTTQLCKVCGSKFYSIDSTWTLIEHLASVHYETKLYACPFGQGNRLRICSNKMYARNYLRNHMHNKHAKETASSWVIGVHTRRKIANAKNFICIHCASNFQSFTQLRNHFNESHGKTRYCCDYCGICLRADDFWEDHMKLFHPEKDHKTKAQPFEVEEDCLFKCQSCFSEFSTQSFLEKHLTNGHRLFENDSTPSKSFKCDLKGCLKRYHTIEQAESHKSSCRFNNYPCHWCTLTNKDAEALAAHIAECHPHEPPVPENFVEDYIHEPYKCEICTKSYMNLYNVRIHMTMEHKLHDYIQGQKAKGFFNQPESVETTTIPILQTHKDQEKTPPIPQNTKQHPPIPPCHICNIHISPVDFHEHHQRFDKLMRRYCPEPQCNRLFSRTIVLRQHNEAAHGFSAQDKPEYYKKLSLPSGIIELSEGENEDNWQKCPICSRYFTKEDFHIHHTRFVSDPDHRTCQFCGQNFKDNLSYYKHIHTVHGVPKNTKMATSKSRITDIITSTRAITEDDISKLIISTKVTNAGGEDEIFTCRSCMKNFKNEAFIRLHIPSAHKYDAFTRLACDECGATFANSNNFYRHKRQQHSKNLTKLLCPFCSSTFSRIEHLRTHSKKFHPNKPLDMKDVKNMPVQELVGTGKELICKLCSKVATSEESLKSHMTTKHFPIHFSTFCDHCGLQLSPLQLKNHLQVYHPEDERNNGTIPRTHNRVGRISLAEVVEQIHEVLISTPRNIRKRKMDTLQGSKQPKQKKMRAADKSSTKKLKSKKVKTTPTKRKRTTKQYSDSEESEISFSEEEEESDFDNFDFDSESESENEIDPKEGKAAPNKRVGSLRTSANNRKTLIKINSTTAAASKRPKLQMLKVKPDLGENDSEITDSEEEFEQNNIHFDKEVSVQLERCDNLIEKYKSKSRKKSKDSKQSVESNVNNNKNDTSEILINGQDNFYIKDEVIDTVESEDESALDHLLTSKWEILPIINAMEDDMEQDEPKFDPLS